MTCPGPAVPTVSVIMPVFNGEKYIAEAAGSILRQSLREIELVVVDDGSTDGTVAAVQALDDDRIRIVPCIGKGEGAARNTGIEVAAAPYIAWHDSDDVAMPHRLDSLLRALDSGAGFAHSDMLVVDAQLSPLRYARTQMIARERVLPWLLRYGTPYNNPTMLLRRETIAHTRFNSSIVIGVDTDFVRRIAPHHVGVHVPEPLVLYRRHDDQLTKTLTAEMLEDEIRHLLEEGAEKLTPEVFRAYGHTPIARSIAQGVLAYHLHRRGLAGQSLAAFQVAFEDATECGSAPVLQAIVHLLNGNGLEAIVTLAPVPRTAVTLFLTAQAHRQIGNHRTAVEMSNEALVLDGESFDPVLALGQCTA